MPDPRTVGPICALLLTCACSETSLVETPTAGVPTRANAIIEVSSGDSESPHLVDFGAVNAGDAGVETLRIRNVGTDSLQVQELGIDDAQVTVLSLEPEVRILAPDSEITARLEFRPIHDGLLDAELRIRSNDRESPVLPVQLRGEGWGPALHVSPPTFDFGDLEIGCGSSLTVEISNVGRTILTVQPVELEPQSTGDEVTITRNLPGPTELAPGQTTTVELAYAPVDVVADSSVLHVLSDDPSAPAAGRSVVQFGTGHPGDSASDDFYQGGVGLTDVLFVVDNSCSMGDEQTTFAANFPGFVPILEADGTDYKLAATTTDAGDNGAFVGSVPIITPSTPNAAATFAANVVLGTSGSGYEQAMLGGWLALNPLGGANPGFLRDSAELHIIFVSDAVDFSTAANAPFQSPQAYVQAFQSLKSDPDKVTLSDISGGLSGCSGPGGSAQASTNLTTATALTGGISASICDADWVNSLAALALLATAVADTFPLTEQAVPDSIEVYLNGSFVPSGWIYDPVVNSIIFDGAYIPDEGDELHVNYTVFGGCEG